MITHDPQLLALRALTAPLLDTEEPLTHLNEISLSSQGAAVCGHVLIDLLEENDLAIGDYEVVIAPEGDGALAAAMIHAAGGRGLDLDAALLRPTQATASDTSFTGAHTVSYTHLDVYKRQGRHHRVRDPRPDRSSDHG